MEDWNLFYPIKIAKRYRNAKRSYLLVNVLQGKHVPVRPEKALEMFSRLGEQIHKNYPKASLVIGFSETATAIGFGVASVIGENCTCLTKPAVSSGIWQRFRDEENTVCKRY